MAPKKVTIVDPVAVVVPPPPPEETPEEKAAKEKAAREAEQWELDNVLRKIPYVDQKELRAGYYAGMEMDRLWKPWQTGGHRHDFFKATRQSRSTDLAKHYEFGELLKRHDKLVFALENWRRCEFLKDDMMIQMRKMNDVMRERKKFQKLRKQIRREQLHYEKSLRWPLSPHAERLDTSSEEEEEEAAPEGSETDPAQPGGGPPPASPGAEGSASEAGSSDAAVETPKKKHKKGPPRVRYSLFHYDLPRHVTPPTPSTRSTSPDEPKEYSFPVTVRSPAYIVGKARKQNELAQQVIALDAWEEKLGGGSGRKPPAAAKKKPSVKK